MALALYEEEVGPEPEKVCHFGFCEHVLLEKFRISVEKRYLKEYSLFSQSWGTVLCTFDDGKV